MNLTLEEVTQINKVQINILRETVEVCRKLEIPFYMVHGSLLGTIRNNGFIPYDDDIDIAIPREHYERFISRAQDLIGANYFIQSDWSDENYPLEFAKVRDSRTTYIVKSVRHIKMNHGIYIDVFPIDYAITGRLANWLHRFYNLRVGCVYDIEGKSIKLKLKQMLACCLLPSVKKTVSKRNKLLRSTARSDKRRITGGKVTETYLPAEWFDKGEKKIFEGIEVYVPAEYDKYLTQIYGNYMERTLVEGKMADSNRVQLNAHIADTEMPYTHYMKL